MNRRSLLQAFGAGAAMSLAPPAAFAQGSGRWLKLESPNFIMYSSASEESTREELAALEGYHAILKRFMPRKRPNPIKLPIYVTRTDRDFEATAPYFKNSGVAGYYTANVERTVAVSKSLRYQPRQRDMPRHVRADDARVYLFHEYTHHYVLGNDRKTYPPWYIEGIAEFFSTAEYTQTGVDLGKATFGRAYSVVRGDWLEIEKLLKRPDTMTGSELSNYYGQAWMATHMFFTKPERAKGFDRYVNALQGEVDPLEAFEPAFGISIKQFDQELREYRKQPLQYWPIAGMLPIDTGITVQRLKPAVDNILLPMVHLQGLHARSSVTDSVNKIREEAKRWPTDTDVMRAAAWTEVWYGDLAAARTKIDALLAVDGQNAESQHVSGLCDLRAAYAAGGDKALFQKAQNAFGRAHSLDDLRASSMFRYVECGIGAAGEVDDNAMEVLIGAYQLAPQVDSIVATTAQALMSRGRFEEATIVLRPLAADPHGGKTSKMAKQLLALAQDEATVAFSLVGAAEIKEDEEEEDES